MPEGLEQRLAAVEEHVRELRRDQAAIRGDAAAARDLAAAADRDVAEFRAELRAHGRVLSALRETQVEQGAAIGQLRTDVDGLRADVTELHAEMRTGFGEVHAGMAQIAELLRTLQPGDD